MVQEEWRTLDSISGLYFHSPSSSFPTFFSVSVLVGAPKARTNQPKVTNGGAVYYCPWHLGKIICTPIEFDNKGKGTRQIWTLLYPIPETVHTPASCSNMEISVLHKELCCVGKNPDKGNRSEVIIDKYYRKYVHLKATFTVSFNLRQINLSRRCRTRNHKTIELEGI